MTRLLFFWIGLLMRPGIALSYEDEELICEHGHAVASLRRNSAQENGPIAGSCRPLISGASKLQNAKCQLRHPLHCKKDIFEPKACTSNEWLGGLISYQLNTTRANLIVPICCTSDHIHVSEEELCETVRVNEFLQPIKYRVPSGRVITKLKCHYIADQNKSVLDFTLHVQVCPFQVNDGRPLRVTSSTSTTSEPATETSTFEGISNEDSS